MCEGQVGIQREESRSEGENEKDTCGRNSMRFSMEKPCVWSGAEAWIVGRCCLSEEPT